MRSWPGFSTSEAIPLTPKPKPEGYENFRTLPELAGYVSVTERTIYLWLRAGKIPKATYVDGMKVQFWSLEDSQKVLNYRISRTASATTAKRRIT